MKKVIVLGSLNMDLSICCDNFPAAGETINGHDFFINPGGKGGNQAVAAARSGAETYMIANVGEDIFGSQLIDSLNASNVNTDYVSVTKNDVTGTATIICHNDDNRIILDNGANYSLTFEHVKKAIDELGNSGDIFLTQFENEHELTRQAIIYAKEKGLFTILNPAPARSIDDELYKSVDLLIINQSECELLSEIYAVRGYYIPAFDFFETKNVNTIITLGKKGSVTKTSDDYLEIAAEKVEAVDTTAAGDSYIGALCAKLSVDESLEDALTYSSKVAATCVTKRGAQVSIPTTTEVYEMFKDVK